MELTSKNVTAIYFKCITPDTKVGQNVYAAGVLYDVNFFAPHLEANKENIESMIDQLPDGFKQDTGGGNSFLNMCLDKNDNMWTGEHVVVERLLLLGIAINRMGFNAPKPMWKVLPGGMPYVFIKNKEG